MRPNEVLDLEEAFDQATLRCIELRVRHGVACEEGAVPLSESEIKVQLRQLLVYPAGQPVDWKSQIKWGWMRFKFEHPILSRAGVVAGILVFLNIVGSFLYR